MKTRTLRSRSDNHKETYDIYRPIDAIIAFVVVIAVIQHFFVGLVCLLVIGGIIYGVVLKRREKKNNLEGNHEVPDYKQ